MKLILCYECWDIVGLVSHEMRYCHCKCSAGKYREDGTSADTYGSTVSIGMNSNDLKEVGRHMERMIRNKSMYTPGIRTWYNVRLDGTNITHHGDINEADE